MPIAAILALLQAVPGIFSTAQAIRADLSENDQAALDQAIATAKAGALVAVSQAESDLHAAAQD